MAKFKAADLKNFKTLLCRNAIIITLYNIFYQYGTLMKNVTRTFVAKGDVGLEATYVSLLVTIFSVTGMVFRVPFGALIDKRRGMLKKVLIIANIYRALVYLGFIVASTKFGITLVYILDAIAFCFCGIAGPAIIGISVDKKAMGSAYAIYAGLTTVCTGTAKSLAVNLYNNYGRATDVWVFFGITILSAVVLFFLDGDALSDSLRKEMEAKAAKGEEAPKKEKGIKGLLAGFCVAAIPFGICSGLVGVANQVSNTYTNLYGVARGYDYLGVQSLVASLAGVFTLIVGFLSDVISPKLLVIVALLAQFAGALIMFNCSSTGMFNTALVLIFGFAFALSTLRIAGMKMLPPSKQGGLSATIMIFMDVLIMFAALPAGALVDKFGGDYSYAFGWSSVISGIALVFWLGFLVFDYFRNKKKANTLAEQAE